MERQMTSVERMDWMAGTKWLSENDFDEDGKWIAAVGSWNTKWWCVVLLWHGSFDDVFISHEKRYRLWIVAILTKAFFISHFVLCLRPHFILYLHFISIVGFVYFWPFYCYYCSALFDTIFAFKFSFLFCLVLFVCLFIYWICFSLLLFSPCVHSIHLKYVVIAAQTIYFQFICISLSLSLFLGLIRCSGLFCLSRSKD